ncbi:MAG TPA: PSD1 and planctomycete cytochrome C domain-containing protein [Pirellulales bacterium]|nr:PSD1 and planctomycete cytochrome C domain-containing protein [Pirellulales bacterium]
MSRPIPRLAFVCLAATLLLKPAWAAADDSAGGRAAVHFGRQILPLLSDRCFKCHGPDARQRQADLRLDDEAAAKTPRDGLAAVVPGRSEASELYRRIASTDPDERMPPADSRPPLSPGEIALVKRWIDEGAAWSGHWAFERLTRPIAPQPGELAEQVRNPIDAFVFARLAREGLTPSPEAPRETLIRRLSLDLLGLPPVPAQTDAFVSDPSPDAYERLVDRLLASPAFGERMAWDWLDAARYADSNGYQGDGERTMYPWRDWVAQAFNGNLPYDKFTVWQLAGDLLPGATPEQTLATGFCRNHMINGEGGRIPEENRVDYVMDMTETLGTVWLGLTLNCCRCHDHKFDPVTQRDYYSLLAYFNQTPVDGGGGNPQTPPLMAAPAAEQTARLAKLAAEVDAAAGALDALELIQFPRDEGQTTADSEKAAAAPDAVKTILKLPAAQRNRGQLEQLETHWAKDSADYVLEVQKLRTAIDVRDGLSRSIPQVMVMADQPQERQTFILEKGLYDKPRDAVTAAVPAKLPRLPQGAPANRLGLAEWLVSPDQPLTARVTVNRLWQQFFGIGLVKTPEDFGVQGERPLHPELLDWLAAEFVDSGWDVKRLCRLVVTSATYRQMSKVSPELVQRDPDNRLLARGARFRLPSWMIRDQALAASGLLAGRMGGVPVNPYQPGDLWADITFDRKHFQQDHGEALYRRSLYTFWRRIVAPSLFFDSGSRQICTVKHLRTNSPLHALTTLNDVTYIEAARALAQRVLTAGPPVANDRVTALFRLVLARRPTAEELSLLAAGVERLKREFAADPQAAAKFLAVGESKRDESLDATEHAAYTAIASAVLNLDEALNKE